MDQYDDPSECCAQPRQPKSDELDYETAIKDMREKERQLSERTAMLENMMHMFSSALSGACRAGPAASTPVPQAVGPNQSAFTLQTPPHTSSQPETAFTGINNSLYSASYPKSYLRDALELVPKYDGHNIPVWQFSRACKRAKDSVPLVDEALFVRMLKNKLAHHAYLAVEDEFHPTLDNFLDTLKRVFGSGRSPNYYRGQLSMAYKRPNEHILDYIGRIKDLKSAIIDGDQTNLGRPLTETEIASIESFALEAFFEGLPREHRVELRAEGYRNFADACSKVLTINKRLEREDARNRTSRTPRENSALSSPTPRVLQREPSSTLVNASGSPALMGRKICSYCKNLGHLVNECRKRRYHENLNARNHGNDNPPPTNANQHGNNYTGNINNHSPRNTGNGPEISAKGTPRDLWKTSPAHCLGTIPSPSTSSEETMGHYRPSNYDQLPSADQLPSCSILELNPT